MLPLLLCKQLAIRSHAASVAQYVALHADVKSRVRRVLLKSQFIIPRPRFFLLVEELGCDVLSTMGLTTRRGSWHKLQPPFGAGSILMYSFLQVCSFLTGPD